MLTTMLGLIHGIHSADVFILGFDTSPPADHNLVRVWVVDGIEPIHHVDLETAARIGQICRESERASQVEQFQTIVSGQVQTVEPLDVAAALYQLRDESNTPIAWQNT